ncbi:TPA: phage N-6-adenine-methyltransferase [Yersinia enterocolitica]|uniref:phage N-6-adenine-methyltransferase n=1 Tax=Yersinia aleksiciae TaxID=263819 RepID=UPI0011A27711|nr:phage N-6-adenine-methyltransferase [Yersinia aleksiciae]HDL7321490.1 phage N-6-adenine-methyltransferase [Yersinia enterocolitica]
MIDFSNTQYVHDLAALKSAPTHKLKLIGDQWRTPDALFWGINAMFGPLVLDLFSDGENAKTPAYYTAEDNALTQDWAAKLTELNGAAFANPPYSTAKKHEGQYITGMRHIMAYTSEMRRRGGRYVYLTKAATSEVWWPEEADHIAFIRGRIGFEVPVWFRPEDNTQVACNAGFGAAIAIFDKEWRGPAISYITREQLLATGEAFLAQIRREAERLIPQNQPQNIPVPETGNTVWPIEVNLYFSKVPGTAELPVDLQHKILGNINRMKLDGIPSDAIIAAATTLTAAMGATA